MAITNANFNNIDYVKLSGKRLITCTSDKIGTANVFNYRFLLEITFDGDTYTYTFRPNNQNYGIINITKILQTFAQSIDIQTGQTVPEGSSATVNQFEQNIHTMPHDFYSSGTVNPYIFTSNPNIKQIQLELFDFYGDTATDVPTKRASGSASADMYIILGYDRESDLINVDYTDYKLTGNTKLFLTNNKTNQEVNVSLTDYGTMSFLNATKDVNASAQPQNLVITYRNASGTSIGSTTLTNSGARGGEIPNVNNTDNYLMTVGCYPANLNKLSSSYTRPQDLPTLSYYEVYFQASGVDKSKKYRFNIVEDCQKYDRQRFAYINDFGVWEYITFIELRTDNINSKPTNIKASVFNYDKSYLDRFTANGNEYRELGYTPNVAHRGEQTVATNFNETFTVNTGYLDNGDVEKVKDMFLSGKISYINTDGSARAVILENSSINAINNINKHYEQVSYSLTFRFSVPTYNNIIY